MTKLFISNVPYEADLQGIEAMFAYHGEVADCHWINDHDTGKFRGFGFIVFENDSDAQAAIEALDGVVLGGRTLQVKVAVDRQARQPREVDPARQLSGLPGTIYVGHIPEGTTEDDLRRFFGEFGRVVEIQILRHGGAAFVRFPHEEIATRVMLATNRAEFNGCPLRVEASHQRA
jgi:RNA recognition motif-containing protein